MNLALVVISKDYQGRVEYSRYLNRCFHVKVRAETPLTREEVEGLRLHPDVYVENMPPEPKRA